MFQQPDGLRPGLYLDLTEDQYHADTALSRGGIQDLLVSASDFWHKSHMNPNRIPEDSKSMSLGKLAHGYLIDRESFWQEHRTVADPYDRNRRTLTQSEFAKVKEMIRRVESVDRVKQLFELGAPEVSIIWIDEVSGIRLRIRCDYLKFFGASEYKTCKNLLPNELGYEIAKYGYDLQDRLYTWGMVAIKRMLNQEIAAGKTPSIFYDSKKVGLGIPHLRPMLEKFLAWPDDRLLFNFVFQRNTPPFPFKLYSFDQDIRDYSDGLLREGITTYKHHIEKYGTSEWPGGTPDLEEFSIYHIPQRRYR